MAFNLKTGIVGTSGTPVAYISTSTSSGQSSGGASGGMFVQSVTASYPLASSGGLNPNISLDGIVDAPHGGTGLNSSGFSKGYLLASDGNGKWEVIAPSFTGNTILHGSGIPDPLNGNNGDFYIDTYDWSLYGPKATNWTFATSLVGPKGDEGISVRNGTGAPSASSGNYGDFYIDTLTYEIFGPRDLVTEWGTGTSLIGPRGSHGINNAGVWSPTGVYVQSDVVIDAAAEESYICKVPTVGPVPTPPSQDLTNWDLFAGKGDQGDIGPAGLSVLSGNRPPLSTEGRAGEFWLDYSKSNLYGPKDAITGWPAYVSLKGASGVRFIPVAFSEYTNTTIDKVISDFRILSSETPNGFNVLVTGFVSTSNIRMGVSLCDATTGIVVTQGEITTLDASTLTLNVASVPAGQTHYELRIKRLQGTEQDIVFVEVAYREVL